MKEREIVKRVPFMSARQVATTALFGALAIAMESMGLYIPYCPGSYVNIGGLLVTGSVMSAGPWAGVIVGILDLLVIPGFGIASSYIYISMALLVAIPYRYIYRITNKTLRVIVFLIYQALVVCWGQFTVATWLTYAVKAFPEIWSCYIYILIVGLPPFFVTWGVLPAILLIFFPDFVRPNWSWLPKRAK